MKRLLKCMRCNELRLEGSGEHIDKFGFACKGSEGLVLARHEDGRKFDGYSPLRRFATLNLTAKEVNNYRSRMDFVP